MAMWRRLDDKRGGACGSLLRCSVVGGSGLDVLEDKVRDLGILLVGNLGVERRLGIVIRKGDRAVAGLVLLGGPNLLVPPETAELASDRGGDDESDDHKGDGEREGGHVEGAVREDVLREGEGAGEDAEGGGVGENPRPESGREVGRGEAGRAFRRENDALREDLCEALARLAGLERDGGGKVRVRLDVVGIVEAVAPDGLRDGAGSAKCSKRTERGETHENTGANREGERQDEVHVARDGSRGDAGCVRCASDARVEVAVTGSSIHPVVGDVQNHEAGE